jgi:hypothetical protein
MTTAMQIRETARDRADFCRCFKTGAAVFLYDDGIVAHSTYRNTLRAAYMPARTNCDTRGASLSELAIIGRYPHPCRDCIKGTVGGGTGYQRADWSTQGRPTTEQSRAKHRGNCCSRRRVQRDEPFKAIGQTTLLSSRSGQIGKRWMPISWPRTRGYFANGCHQWQARPMMNVSTRY